VGNVTPPGGGFTTVTPDNTTTYNLTCTNSQTGQSCKDPATVTVNGIILKDPQCSIRPPSQVIDYGNPATLSWSSTNTVSCSSPQTDFNSLINGATSGGPVNLHPTVTTTYELDCNNDTNPVKWCSFSAPVTVSIAGDCSIKATPTGPVRKGDKSTISWNMTNSHGTCAVTGPEGQISTELVGSAQETISAQSTYNIACKVGTLSCNDSVTVGIVPIINEF